MQDKDYKKCPEKVLQKLRDDNLAGDKGRRGRMGRGQGKLRGSDGIRRLITIEFSLERFLQVKKGT